MKMAKKSKNKINKKNIVVPAKKLPIIPHIKDWRHSFHWRVLRIMSEFVDGFQFLTDFKKSVSFFGSAKFKPGNKWYKEAQKLAKMLVKAGFTIITGGGPGIMEAANRGAFENQGESVGLNIQLPYEQRINPYVKKAIGFHYFFTRKVMLSFAAQAYIFFPGGFGTLDEFLEISTLIQTHKIYEKIPVILVGKDFWSGLDQWLKTKCLKEYKTLDPQDFQIYKIVDSAEEAFEIIKKSKPRKEII